MGQAPAMLLLSLSVVVDTVLANVYGMMMSGDDIISPNVQRWHQGLLPFHTAMKGVHKLEQALRVTTSGRVAIFSNVPGTRIESVCVKNFS